MGQEKKLYRNVHSKVIAGVASGLAEYFDVDVVIFRLLFVLLVLFGGGGLLAYIVMWIVIPPQPIVFQANYNHSEAPPASAGKETHAEENTSAKAQAAPSPAVKRDSHSNTSLIAGIILISMGVLFLINRTMPWINLANLWPVLLIIGGFFIIDPNILKSKNRQQ